MQRTQHLQQAAVASLQVSRERPAAGAAQP
jgi:hypothetical protein